ncbi:MAG TPA: flagellar filament capping protein FliD [Bdellovibrionales bacterium]|nr:flagellar filament capping protein FliD [Bdellovibrionales bacterium]
MSTIRFGSINTGLPPNIVDQLVEAEKIPIKNMEAKKAKVEAKSKLVDDLQTKISDIRKGLTELASTRGFSDIKLTSGDPNVISGTVDPANYQAGSWNIEVVQMAQKASAVTNGFPDKDETTIGVGYFRFDTPDGSRDVYVKSGQNTLEGAAKAINSAKVGVKASVINDRKNPDEPYKLVLSSDGTGNEKSVTYPRIYMLDGDQDIFFDSESEAKNGVVKVDGMEFEISDNVLKDVIPGVALELKQANPGKSISVSVKEDLELVSGKVKTFVDGMNGVFQFIQDQNKMNKDTDTSKTLGGDGIIRSVETRLRQLIQNPQYGVAGSIKTLNQVGITFNRNGLLEYDQKKFNTALASNPDAVQNFFVGDGYQTGFISAVKREVNSLLNPAFGPISNRSRGLKQNIDQMDQRIAQKELQIAKKEDMLRAKFSRLEETMSKLKAQGGAVGAMGGGGGGMMGMPGAGG